MQISSLMSVPLGFRNLVFFPFCYLAESSIQLTMWWEVSDLSLSDRFPDDPDPLLDDVLDTVERVDITEVNFVH